MESTQRDFASCPTLRQSPSDSGQMTV